jgi:NADPH-dependent ferric siderophore reductase
MVQVKRIERPTPGCVRIAFGGGELKGYEMRGPASHLKVVFGELPEWGP